MRINANDSPIDASESLARKISENIAKHGEELVPKPEPKEDVIARLKESLEGRKLPTVSVRVTERHNGSPTIDPAAETEVGYMLQQLGFTVVDALKSTINRYTTEGRSISRPPNLGEPYRHLVTYWWLQFQTKNPHCGGAS